MNRLFLIFNLEFLLEFGPLIAFFATYKLSKSDLRLATIWIMITTALCCLLKYVFTKKISLPMLISGGILWVAGSIMLATGNTKYVKMKPTIVFALFGFVTYIGVMFNKFFVKDVMGHKIHMQEKHWKTLSLRIVYYCIFLAILNEVSWRLMSENAWVNFKIFGITTTFIMFAITQLNFIEKNSIQGFGKLKR
ncbi:inner membrane-spanning protein YciB [Candidatus Sneabacter namystus]|uniref:Inner membrane-spanning protein YciB n=1 Tax=Candidatus Sneabacter namystus TaxID=2601646 RepID=A0A5C0UIM7_9RICK|nr:septation protein IspZ [Candidatus Sneabacter namystus]QEK39649.1 septation protein A [Candidatus Sneabacter namystus]